MIELDFQQFHDQKYREQRYELYMLKNGLGDILYIGISKNDVWQRWFGWGGHMTWDGKVIYGESPVGVKIENHLPDSLSWKIQLWTLTISRFEWYLQFESRKGHYSEESKRNRT